MMSKFFAQLISPINDWSFVRVAAKTQHVVELMVYAVGVTFTALNDGIHFDRSRMDGPGKQLTQLSGHLSQFVVHHAGRGGGCFSGAHRPDCSKSTITRTTLA